MSVPPPDPPLPGATPSPSPDTAPTPPRRLPSRNPIPLSASQEGEVRKAYYARVRAICAKQVLDYADCATGRTFSAAWKCSEQKLAMNSCMIKHATLEVQDEAREEWFAQREQRARDREAQAEKIKKQEEFLKIWWGVDEKGRGGQDRSKPKVS